MITVIVTVVLLHAQKSFLPSDQEVDALFQFIVTS